MFRKRELLEQYLKENNLKVIKIKSSEEVYWDKVLTAHNRIEILHREENRLGNIYYHYLDTIDNLVYEVFFVA